MKFFKKLFSRKPKVVREQKPKSVNKTLPRYVSDHPKSVVLPTYQQEGKRSSGPSPPPPVYQQEGKRSSAPIIASPANQEEGRISAPTQPPQLSQERVSYPSILVDRNYAKLILTPKKDLPIVGGFHEAMCNGMTNSHLNYAYDIQSKGVNVGANGCVLVGINFSNYAVGEEFVLSSNNVELFRVTLTEENINETFQPIGGKYNAPLLLMVLSPIHISRTAGNKTNCLDEYVTLTFLSISNPYYRSGFMKIKSMYLNNNNNERLHIHDYTVSIVE